MKSFQCGLCYKHVIKHVIEKERKIFFSCNQLSIRNNIIIITLLYYSLIKLKYKYSMTECVYHKGFRIHEIR